MGKVFDFLIFGLVSLLVVVAGCCISMNGCMSRVKYEKVIILQAPLEAGSAFATQNHNGSITIKGCDVSDCNITATIIARAGSEEEAQRIAEETNITLETLGNKLTAEIEKPGLISNQSVSIDFDVTVPRQTDLHISSHNGTVKVANITGNIKATTHNGSVICKEISGDVKLGSHNGNVKAVYCESARPVCNVSISTHNGNVNFKAPPDFSAKVDASTHNGSIRTDLPIMVSGKINKGKLTGKIGAGEGSLYLKTHNGSIKIE
jgi:hypothetical protein